ncbi:MAG: HAMP domain-containing sensor histidine kinase [Pseudomonadota bacterium]
MLHEFLASHRLALIDRCKTKVANRAAAGSADADLRFGIPLFLDQLIKTLRTEQQGQARHSLEISGTDDGTASPSEIGASAARHGLELLRNGFTVDEVVHNYGDLCQAITGLAVEMDAPISTDEFRTLNRCLDNGIADAVTEYSRQREIIIKDSGEQALNERLGVLAHELRNHISTAVLAASAMRSGNVALTGATSAVLDRSLVGLRNLVDRTLADVRVSAGMETRQKLFSVADFIAEVRVTAALEARTRGSEFSTFIVDRKLSVHGDREMLMSALGNLLQNAFKFTCPGTAVSLNAFAQGELVLIEVQDHCGGLPPDAVKDMFIPFVQLGTDRTGMGLGLSICKRIVEANDGQLRVRDLPGSGCVFTIELPRHAAP